MFFWKKTNTTPSVFTYTAPKDLDRSPQIDYTPMRQSRLQEYVHTVKTTEVEKDAEAKAADELLKLFTDPQANAVMPSSAPIVPTGRITEMTIETPKMTTPVATPASNVGSASAQPVDIVKGATPITIPNPTGVTPDLIATPTKSAVPVQSGSLQAVTSPSVTRSGDVTHPVEPLKDFPFPNKPTNPNMLAGMVVSSENRIVEGAIITITRQSDNTPVRAIKTNTLGQFAVVTPLENGSYTILTEKDGLRFDKYSLVLNNHVVEPILIKSQKNAL